MLTDDWWWAVEIWFIWLTSSCNWISMAPNQLRHLHRYLLRAVRPNQNNEPQELRENTTVSSWPTSIGVVTWSLFSLPWSSFKITAVTWVKPLSSSLFRLDLLPHLPHTDRKLIALRWWSHDITALTPTQMLAELRFLPEWKQSRDPPPLAVQPVSEALDGGHSGVFMIEQILSGPADVGLIGTTAAWTQGDYSSHLTSCVKERPRQHNAGGKKEVQLQCLISIICFRSAATTNI